MENIISKEQLSETRKRTRFFLLMNRKEYYLHEALILVK